MGCHHVISDHSLPHTPAGPAISRALPPPQGPLCCLKWGNFLSLPLPVPGRKCTCAWVCIYVCTGPPGLVLSLPALRESKATVDANLRLCLPSVRIRARQ